MSGKVLASQEITLKGDGEIQSETLVFNCGDAGPKTLEIGVEPVAGEENTRNNLVSRLVNVESRTAAHPLFRGRAALGIQVHPARAGRFSDIEISSMLRTTENKLYRQGFHNEQELEDGFPTKPEELFPFQALIIGSVEANYFTPTQQQLIHDFVDRRGGGLLFLGGRSALSDGGYQRSPLADLIPTALPDRYRNVPPRFYRRGADARRRAERDRPAR